jgi:hypothetical protein
MILNAFIPIFSQMIANLIGWFKQRSDQKWEKDGKKAVYTTKKTQIN